MRTEERHAYYKSTLRTRAEPDGGAKYIEGYFAVFDEEIELWQGEFERIAPGAFAASLRDNDIRCLFNHEHGFVLGRMQAGTLELREDSHGLWGRVAINENDPAALGVYARVQRGDISGCSFGFYPKQEKLEQRGDASYHWTVTEADTFEVSICTFPAYPSTEIEARQRARKQTANERIAHERRALKERLEALKHAETVTTAQ